MRFTLLPLPPLISRLKTHQRLTFWFLPYLYFILFTPLPDQGLDFAVTPMYGKQAKVQNEILIVISWCDLWLLRAFKVSVSATNASVQQHSGQHLRNFIVSTVLLIIQINCCKYK